MDEQLKIKRKDSAPIYPFMAMWRTMTVLVRAAPGVSDNIVVLDNGEMANRSKFDILSLNNFDGMLRLEKGSRFTFTQV